MARKKTDNPSKKDAENRLRLKFHYSSLIANTANNIVKWGFLTLIVYFIYRMVDCLSGAETNAVIGIKFITDIRVREMAGTTFGIAGSLYGLNERRLRKRDIERLKTRDPGKEKQIDPKRSSSLLTKKGDTRAEDKNDL